MGQHHISSIGLVTCPTAYRTPSTGLLDSFEFVLDVHMYGSRTSFRHHATKFQARGAGRDLVKCPAHELGRVSTWGTYLCRTNR